MASLKNLWKRGFGSGDVYKPPEKDEHMVACDTLMSELDFHIREIDRFKRDQEQESRRLQTGVDYSWLMESSNKIYEIPQMERLELEELCYKATGPECTHIISLFRDAMSRDPRVEDLPYIMRSCVKKALDERPVQETLSDWVSKRKSSLANLAHFRLRPPGKVMPTSAEAEDIEMQSNEPQTRDARAMSMPNFSVRNEGSAYPV